MKNFLYFLFIFNIYVCNDLTYLKSIIGDPKKAFRLGIFDSEKQIKNDGFQK